jgi:hypothetical protein
VIDSHVQNGIVTLRTKLMRHARNGAPWEARDALDVIAVLDTPAWAALVGLIDQLPTLHAARHSQGATHRIDPSAFEFISEAAHISTGSRFHAPPAGQIDGLVVRGRATSLDVRRSA